MLEGLCRAASSVPILRHPRQAITLGLLAALSLILVVYAYADQRGGFSVALALSLGTNLVIVIATYLIFNPLIEQVRTATTHEHPRLDWDAFIEHAAGSRKVLSILTTWTNLLDDPYRHRFLSAMRTALNRNVLVQILLLDPTSKAADVRSEELHWREDVSGAIMANLRHLEQFRAELNERTRPQLQVRVYSASPSVLFYRWDNMAYISFFAIGKLAEDAPKLETFVTTPWAYFVQRRFEEIWEDAATASLDHYLHLPLTVCDRADTPSEFQVEYVTVEGIYYVVNSSLTQFISRHGVENLTASAGKSPDSAANAYALRILADLPDVAPMVLGLFRSKYEHDLKTEVFCLSDDPGRDHTAVAP